MPPYEDATDPPGDGPGSARTAGHTVTLASAIDLDGFRQACRMLWAEQVEPDRVSWHCADEADRDLFGSAQRGEPAPALGAPPVSVPARFLALCQSVVLHRDADRFGLLYRLLWRLQVEPGLRHDPQDADWVQAQEMSQAVRRDMNKMKTLLRFGTIENAGETPLHVAWFEPEHHIVEATAPFFAHRFANTRWTILTPQRSARWDGEALVFGPGGRRDEAPPADDDAAPTTLAALGDALERCRECPIGEHATQAVPGEGVKNARFMFVGEQPGDQEDLRGRPFVGPAGQLFDRALAELGIARSEAYVSNAVKHFKFELRGQRRIHKTPAQEEAAACLHWLESEIALVDPGALIALGATAARQLMGAPIAVTRSRGQWLKRADGRRVLITLHPSALLRMDPADKEAAWQAWLADLRQLTFGPHHDGRL